jgi:SNF2 family DNA or RNA helicase
VFVPYRHAVEGLSKILDLHDPKHNIFKIDHAMVHGDILPKERDKIFNLFQNTNKYRVLLAHPACCHHGLTLTAADTVIWYCPPLSYEVYEQANARISRVGQKHRQQVIHLQATPVERKIYRLLQSKEAVQDQLLAMFQEATM